MQIPKLRIRRQTSGDRPGCNKYEESSQWAGFWEREAKLNGQLPGPASTQQADRK